MHRTLSSRNIPLHAEPGYNSMRASMKAIWKYSTLLILAAAAGCHSPDAWREQADEVADRTIAEFQRKALGAEEPFSIERPSDTLRAHLMLDQNLPVYTNRANVAIDPEETLLLDQIACLQVAARNSRSYQDQKEEVFRSALALDLERDAFRNSWAGTLSALFSSDQSGEENEDRLSGGLATQFSRTLKSGASIAVGLGLDVVKLLTLDRSSSYGLLADATITVPLMRGAGRAIVTEPLTQAERELMYTLWRFDRYRRSFAVQISNEYFSVLQSADELRNARDSVARLEISLERSQQLAEAGRMPELEVDQTRQDLLRARSNVVAALQNSQGRLDSFKQTLGLPVDARIALDESELDDFSAWEREIEADESDPDQSALVATALSGRLDLRISYEQMIDSARRLAVARDALRMGLEFKASASNQERRHQGTDTPDAQLHGRDRPRPALGEDRRTQSIPPTTAGGRPGPAGTRGEGGPGQARSAQLDPQPRPGPPELHHPARGPQSRQHPHREHPALSGCRPRQHARPARGRERARLGQERRHLGPGLIPQLAPGTAEQHRHARDRVGMGPQPLSSRQSNTHIVP